MSTIPNNPFPTDAQIKAQNVAADNLVAQQAYDAALNEYTTTEVPNWLTNAAKAQQLGEPLPPVPAIPAKTVYAVSADGTSIISSQWQDPTIVPPSLPPLPPPVPSPTGALGGIGTGPQAQAADAAADAPEQAMLVLLAQLLAGQQTMQADITAIKTKTGA